MMILGFVKSGRKAWTTFPRPLGPCESKLVRFPWLFMPVCFCLIPLLELSSTSCICRTPLSWFKCEQHLLWKVFPDTLLLETSSLLFHCASPKPCVYTYKKRHILPYFLGCSFVSFFRLEDFRKTKCVLNYSQTSTMHSSWWRSTWGSINDSWWINGHLRWPFLRHASLYYV